MIHSIAAHVSLFDPVAVPDGGLPQWSAKLVEATATHWKLETDNTRMRVALQDIGMNDMLPVVGDTILINAAGAITAVVKPEVVAVEPAAPLAKGTTKTPDYTPRRTQVRM